MHWGVNVQTNVGPVEKNKEQLYAVAAGISMCVAKVPGVALPET